MKTDTCKFCGSHDLFSGHFDEEGFAVPQNIDDKLPAGVSYRTVCNECGEFQPTGRKK